MGTNLPTLLATLTGNLFELAELSGVRLLDLDLPPAFAEAYAGPALGIDGTRRLTCVQHRPLIGTIIKPSVGLSPQATADLVKVLVDGGVDFIKDDELMANPPHSPLAERGVRRVVVAGGDTSGYVVRALGIQALEMAAPTTPGAPVCRAYAADALDGVQLILKGGQVGRDAFFVDARERVEHQ
jgi:ribulose-bisphosphate carboxylase large chain